VPGRISPNPRGRLAGKLLFRKLNAPDELVEGPHWKVINVQTTRLDRASGFVLDSVGA
jgi:hypothetical protein